MGFTAAARAPVRAGPKAGDREVGFAVEGEAVLLDDLGGAQGRPFTHTSTRAVRDRHHTT